MNETLRGAFAEVGLGLCGGRGPPAGQLLCVASVRRCRQRRRGGRVGGLGLRPPHLRLSALTPCPVFAPPAALPVQASASDSWTKAATAFNSTESGSAEVSVRRAAPC